MIGVLVAMDDVAEQSEAGVGDIPEVDNPAVLVGEAKERLIC